MKIVHPCSNIQSKINIPAFFFLRNNAVIDILENKEISSDKIES